MSEDTPSRITVSRDALRADLAEMELRLRTYFDEQLRHKANAADLASLALKVERLDQLRSDRDRGEFTPAATRAMRSLIEEINEESSDKEWTSRERLMAVLSVLTAGTMLVLSILLAVHGR